MLRLALSGPRSHSLPAAADRCGLYRKSRLPGPRHWMFGFLVERCSVWYRPRGLRLDQVTSCCPLVGHTVRSEITQEVWFEKSK